MEVSISQVASNAKKIKQRLADDTGLELSQINDKNLKEAGKVLDGAKVVDAQGGDPTKVPVQDLKAAGGGDAKEKSSPEDLSNQQKLAMSLAVIAPTLIGYAFGGAEGGSIGAQAGGKAVDAYGKGLETEKEKQRLLAEKGADRALKERELAKDERKLAEEGKRKDRELDLKDKEIAANKDIKRMERELAGIKDKKDLEIKLSQNFQGNQLVKDHSQATVGVQKIRQAGDVNDNAYDDMALIFNYMKVLDPGSTVREGEFQTAQNNAGLLQRLGVQWEKVKNGGRLDAAQRQKLVEAAERQYAASEDSFNTYKGEFQRVAQEYGVKPENVTLDFAGRSGPVAKKPAPGGGGNAGGGNPLQNEARAAAPAGRSKELEQMSVEELEAHIKKLRGE